MTETENLVDKARAAAKEMREHDKRRNMRVEDYKLLEALADELERLLQRELDLEGSVDRAASRIQDLQKENEALLAVVRAFYAKRARLSTVEWSSIHVLIEALPPETLKKLQEGAK